MMFKTPSHYTKRNNKGSVSVSSKRLMISLNELSTILKRSPPLNEGCGELSFVVSHTECIFLLPSYISGSIPRNGRVEFDLERAP